MGYQDWTNQRVSTGMWGITNHWLKCSSPTNLILLSQDFTKVTTRWTTRWTPTLLLHNCLQLLHLMTSLAFFNCCLQHPGLTVGDWSENTIWLLLCYDTTIQDTVLLQRNINQHSLLPPPYDKFPTSQEEEIVTACPPLSTPPQQQCPSATPKPVNAYLRKTCAVNRKVCHLYSFQWLIVLEDIYFFYPIYLLTRIGH